MKTVMDCADGSKFSLGPTFNYLWFVVLRQLHFQSVTVGRNVGLVYICELNSKSIQRISDGR